MNRAAKVQRLIEELALAVRDDNHQEEGVLLSQQISRMTGRRAEVILSDAKQREAQAAKRRHIIVCPEFEGSFLNFRAQTAEWPPLPSGRRTKGGGSTAVDGRPPIQGAKAKRLSRDG